VHLSDLIGNLLFLARAESPLTLLDRERVDVAELLGAVREYYEGSAADGGISLTTSVGDEPVIGELDRALVQRALSNLISNAVAHTPPGGAVVLATNMEGASIRIDVTDTGVGIPPEALPKVFDRFFRVDPSRSRASGGTGLGLAIVRGIMLLHGGNVEIASQPGQGTRVTLRVPAQRNMTKM
jgi:two-component system, OmpR family, heavy metal sensor histidine kinase CusS